MDKFSSLKAFKGVVEEGSFAAAARVSGMSRSQTNKLVIALEEHLGVQLFNRSTRHVAPTSEGLAFYQRAKQILDDLEEAETSLSSTATEAIGHLRVSTPLSLGALNFSGIVIDFMKRHPALQVELIQDARIVDPIAEGFDCVIRIAPPNEETALVDHRIASVEYVTCASSDYFSSVDVPKHPDDLKDHALLHYPGSSNSRFWHYSGAGGPISVEVKPMLTANNFEAIREAACAGLGIATLPRYAVRDELQSGSMVAFLEAYGLPNYMLQLIYPPSRHLSAKVRLFTDYLIDCFSDAEFERSSPDERPG
ncbi:MAG: LysR substrate-binding domain-containing protein [Pseudomonadota bacterium]